MQYRESNQVKTKLQQKRKVAAAWAQAGSNITAEILAEAGFDMVMIDLEHGAGDIPVLITQIQALKGLKAVPMVRAPWNDFVTIKRILDSGAYGLLIPYVNTREEAESAVQAVRYPLDGIRGVAGSARAAHYGNNSLEYMQSARDEIFLMVAVETVEAVKHIEEITAVEGIDAIFIGPNDLASSYGSLMNPNVQPVKEAIRKIEEAVIPSGKALSTVAGSFNDAREKYDRGYDLLMLMSDTTTLSKTAKGLVDEFNKVYQE